MNISADKLYELLDTTDFLCHGSIVDLLDSIIETHDAKVKWHGEIYDLSADKESGNKE